MTVTLTPGTLTPGIVSPSDPFGTIRPWEPEALALGSESTFGDLAASRPQPRTRPDGRRLTLRTGRRAVILDLDGTLLDTREAHALSWLVALHDAGHDLQLETLRSLVGLTAAEILSAASGLPPDGDDGRRVLQRRAEIFRTWYLKRLRPFMGARALLQRMRREGLRLVATTAGTVDEAVGLLRAAGIGDLLDDAVAQDDRLGLTTHNEVIEAAVAQCACVRDGILLLGDTPYDIEAGRRQRVAVVALRCGGWSDAALQGALAVYDDPRDLLDRFEQSPFSLPGLARRAVEAAADRPASGGLSLVQ
jgi:phosphoglycolate phosphatase-like HAD superfamily hydrolase